MQPGISALCALTLLASTFAPFGALGAETRQDAHSNSGHVCRSEPWLEGAFQESRSLLQTGNVAKEDHARAKVATSPLLLQSFVRSIASKVHEDFRAYAAHRLGISPEDSGSLFLWFEAVLVIIIAVGLFAICWGYMSSATGELVRQGIHTYDRDLVGVDITVGAVDVQLGHGIVHLRDLVVNNPPGYNAHHLLTIRDMMIDIDTQHLAATCFDTSDLIVEKVRLLHVDIVSETRGFGWNMTSNVQEVLNFISTNEPEQVATVVEVAPSDGRGLSMHEIIVDGVVVTRQSHTMTNMGIPGVKIALPRIHFQDFAEEFGNKRLDEMIKLLVKRILYAVLHHVDRKAQSAMAGAQQYRRGRGKACC